MNITCPNCGTSYGVDAAAFGSGGRSVRCARCRETWQAIPEETVAALASASAGGENALSDQGGNAEASVAQDDWPDKDTPVVDSPSIAHDGNATDAEWTELARAEDRHAESPQAAKRRSWRLPAVTVPSWLHLPDKFRVRAPVIIAAAGTLVLCLLIWRKDVVHLLPQTATLFRSIGFGVNLRNLAFDNVKISTETVNGKPVLVIEGAIVGTTGSATAIPRLRFVVHDVRGTEIYAWNSVPEQPVLNPGDRVWFRSRLAAPPKDAYDISVRFFNRRDIGA